MITKQSMYKLAQDYQKELVRAAKKNDQRRIQQLVSDNPRFNPMF